MFPSKEEAENLLIWADRQNPGLWVNHCRVVARAAEAIAHKCGLDTERAYVSGLLHDIGYYDYRNGKGRTCHIYIGYELMIEKGYGMVAEICLSHSFPYQNVRAYGNPSEMNCTDKELTVIDRFLSGTTYNDYDKLIQLCDNIGTAQGICTTEKRMLDVVRRHGFGDFTLKRWDSFFALKDYFDKKCGVNIYNLFFDEIKANIFDS